MQSIIDKLQSPQTLDQTSKELMSLAARGNYGLTSLLHVIQQPIKVRRRPKVRILFDLHRSIAPQFFLSAASSRHDESTLFPSFQILEWNIEKMASSGRSVLDFITAALSVVDCCLQLMQQKSQVPAQQPALNHTAYKYKVSGLCKKQEH